MLSTTRYVQVRLFLSAVSATADISIHDTIYYFSKSNNECENIDG